MGGGGDIGLLFTHTHTYTLIFTFFYAMGNALKENTPPFGNLAVHTIIFFPVRKKPCTELS